MQSSGEPELDKLRSEIEELKQQIKESPDLAERTVMRNLLLTLDMLLAEGSVAAAARRLRLSLSLSLSPSAMSRTLARLRETTGDPLLVRAGRGLVPTPHAIALRERVGPRCPRRAPALGAKARQGQRAPAPGQRGPGDRRAGKNHGP